MGLMCLDKVQNYKKILISLLLILVLDIRCSALNNLNTDWSVDGGTVTLAKLIFTFEDPVSGKIKHSKIELGRFGAGSAGNVFGLLVLGQSYTNRTDVVSGSDKYGCSKGWLSQPPDEPWIGLVASGGGCSDHQKVQVASTLNASAVIVYAADQHAHIQQINLGTASGELQK